MIPLKFILAERDLAKYGFTWEDYKIYRKRQNYISAKNQKSKYTMAKQTQERNEKINEEADRLAQPISKDQNIPEARREQAEKERREDAGKYHDVFEAAESPPSQTPPPLPSEYKIYEAPSRLTRLLKKKSKDGDDAQSE